MDVYAKTFSYRSKRPPLETMTVGNNLPGQYPHRTKYSLATQRKSTASGCSRRRRDRTGFYFASDTPAASKDFSPPAERPADRQSVVPVPQADCGPLQALASGLPLLQPQIISSRSRCLGRRREALARLIPLATSVTPGTEVPEHGVVERPVATSTRLGPTS